MVINGQSIGSTSRMTFTCVCCGKTFTVAKGFLDMVGEDMYSPMCNECFDKDLDRMREEDMKFQKEHIADIWMSEMDIPTEDRDASFDNFNARDEILSNAMNASKKFVNDKNTVLAFIGKTGTGKTHLAVSCLREWCKATSDPNVFYTTETAIFNEIMGSINSKTDSPAKVAERYTKYDRLVIDEIGRSKKSEFTVDKFMEIIMRRLSDAGKKTIIIGNLTVEQYREYFPDAMLSRMKAGGDSFVFRSSDYRGIRRPTSNCPKTDDLL